MASAGVGIGLQRFQAPEKRPPGPVATRPGFTLSVNAVPPPPLVSMVIVVALANSPTPGFGGAGATTSQPVVKPHVRAILNLARGACPSL